VYLISVLALKPELLSIVFVVRVMIERLRIGAGLVSDEPLFLRGVKELFLYRFFSEASRSYSYSTLSNALYIIRHPCSCSSSYLSAAAVVREGDRLRTSRTRKHAFPSYSESRSHVQESSSYIKSAKKKQVLFLFTFYTSATYLCSRARLSEK